MDTPTRQPRNRTSRPPVRGRGGRSTRTAGGDGARAALSRTLWRTAPLFLAAALSIAGSLHLLPAPAITAPLRVFIVVAALLIGVGATLLFDRASARPYWQVTLVVVVIQMPVFAVLSSAARAPFVALARGSAGPLLWMTLACALVLLAVWVFVVLQSGDPAENASLLLLLPALIVPAMFGAGADLDESSSLAMVGESALLAGVASLLGLLGPVGWRPLVAVVTFVVQFAGLWLIGQGPVLGAQAGFVSFASLGFMILLAMLMLVTAPLGTLFTRRFFQTVSEESGIATPASVPQKGARRRSDS